ncbi:MAG TPA: peptidoglycan DD-metalloendopeptidase family protein [Chromatiaceae bacterium]|nr:peptidoglycan DD-metalloendopeptidase family protein [Chromatiaceae bacterium]
MGLSGCASQTPAPVFGWDETAPAPEGYYRVKAGDTLSEVALALKIDSADLVLWNDLKPPYKIVSGRLLRIGPPAEGLTSPVVAGTQGGGVEGQEKQGRAPVAGSDANSAKPDMPVKRDIPVKQVRSVKDSPKVDEVRPRRADVNPSKAAGDAGGAATLRWQWPLPGPVRQTFVRGDRTRAGIRIAGRSGDQVKAAEAGSVVYSGSGLKGYGNLIIIQHNKDFLSAYGFNRRLLVKEGARVKRGQAVAEIGQAAGGDWLLHFEIRKNGNAVDPLGYLPSTR